MKYVLPVMSLVVALVCGQPADAQAPASSPYVINLADYAKGDGTDETDAIQAAIDALLPLNPIPDVANNHPGGVLYIPRPPNCYAISKTLVFNERWNVVVRCESPVFGTRNLPVNHYFRWIGPDNGTMFEFNGCKGIRVENLSMTGMDHVSLDPGTEYGLPPIGRHTSGVTGISFGPPTGAAGFLTEAVFDQLYIGSVDIGIKLGNHPNSGPDVRTIEFRSTSIMSFAQYGIIGSSGNLANITFSTLETMGCPGAKSSIYIQGGELLILNWTTYCPNGALDADISIDSGGVHVIKAWSEWGGPFLRTGLRYPEQTDLTSGAHSYPIILEGVRHYRGGFGYTDGVNSVPKSIIYNLPVPLHLIGCSLWGGVELGSESMSTIIDHGTVFIDKDALGFMGDGITKYGRVIHIGTRKSDNGRILEPYVVDRRNTPGTAAPTTGIWKKGDRIINIDPDPTNPDKAWDGWICMTAGEPGVWAPYGQIANQ